MTTSPRAPLRRRPLLRVGSSLALLVALHLAIAAPLRAGASESAPSAAERSRYWFDRMTKGAEPTSFELPSFHKALLVDIERNLVANPDATLDRLADEEFAARLQAQEDQNPWHTALAVLAAIGPRRPDVARRWAVPAIEHPTLTLRRAAIDVFEALSSPIDVPVLVRAYERDASDSMLGSRLAALLLRLGSGADSVAAAHVFARGPADGPTFSEGVWLELPDLAAKAPGGARPDLLAWWALLTDTTGPRAADPRRGADGKGASIDPARLRVVAMQHTLTGGAAAATAARVALARAGAPTARRQVREDRDAPSPLVREVARDFGDRLVTEQDRVAARERAAACVQALVGPARPPVSEVAAIARALRTDESPEALRLLLALFRAIPVHPDWKLAVLEAFDGLVVRGERSLPDELGRLLARGDADGIDLALHLARRSGGAGFIPVIEAWMNTPAAAEQRLRARRELAYLYVGLYQHRSLDPESTARFAGMVHAWVEDESDPSSEGFVAVLADLGEAGEREIALGLRGPSRARYVAGLGSGGEHYLGSDVVAALLEPVARRTAAVERRALLSIAFRVASADAVPALEALSSRLPDDARADVETVLRIVRHREPIPR